MCDGSTQILITEKKVEPKRLHVYLTQLHPWHYGATSEDGAVFFQNMIIKGKKRLRGGTIFQNGSMLEPFWLHCFSQ